MKYHCYLGNTESERHTLMAKNFKDLRKKVVARFSWQGARWYKNNDLEGYPKGSLRFILKTRKWKQLGIVRMPLLVIPREGNSYED